MRHNAVVEYRAAPVYNMGWTWRCECDILPPKYCFDRFDQAESSAYNHNKKYNRKEAKSRKRSSKKAA